MPETEYLYGAAVQGIQSFIFQTNELKDIVGASELVEQICKTDFEEFAKNGEIILHAAGNIKCIFKDENECKNAVLNFPEKVMEKAPGITISQAVVTMKGKFASFPEAVNELERRLRIQRNKPLRSMTLGLMGVRRSRTTGLPATEVIKGDYIDSATFNKRYEWNDKKLKEFRKRTTKKLCEKSIGHSLDDDEIAYNIGQITKDNDWIAVIHADGNGLGQIVQKIGSDKDKFKEFSEKLDEATMAASVAAYNRIAEQFNFDREKVIPIRPIVLGGDDFTVICRGDFAIPYVTEFLRQFETETKEKLGKTIKDNNVFGNEKADKLTACAGVAFIKSSFPFYYGYNLAESLCGRAKKDAKKAENLRDNQAQSCLMFHKVQDSFVIDFNEIAKRELTPIVDAVSFEYGPYYINPIDSRMSIDKLISYPEKLSSKEGNAIKSHMRQWMSLLHDKGEEAATRKIDRLRVISSNNSLIDELLQCTEKVNETGNEIKVYPVYDILSVCSIVNQKTKK
jgi:hypothetical protein